MAETPARKSQAEKIEDARDLQSKLYREIGISAVAAALRFTSPSTVAAVQGHPMPGHPRGDNLAA